MVGDIAYTLAAKGQWRVQARTSSASAAHATAPAPHGQPPPPTQPRRRMAVQASPWSSTGELHRAGKRPA
jgi:hypothetical protein